MASVTDAVAAGARAIVAITAGLSEAGPEGARLEAEALAIARGAGAVLVGPNCLGIVDTTTGLQLAHAVLPAGDVAVLSQSGNLVLDLAGLLADRGLGVSRFVSLGNQADLGVVDFLHACVGHEGTRAVAVYTEDVVDGRAFLDAARALRDAGKPLVLLAPGRTEAAVRSAASHTGSLTSSSMVIDAACAAVGAHRVDHPTQMADLLVALRVPRRMPGRRAAILTDGGGHGAVAADALAAAGLRTPVLTGPVTTELEAALWAQATVTNPVDLAGAGEQDVASYARGVQTLLASDQVDGVLLTGYFGGYSTEQSNLTGAGAGRGPPDGRRGRGAGQATRRADDLPGEPGQPGAAGRGHPGAPGRRSRVHGAGRPRRARDGRPRRGAPGPCAARHRHVVRRGAGAVRVTPASRSRSPCRSPTPPGWRPRSTLLPFPVVLKATGRLHKSEGGGVVVGLADRDEVRAAYADLVTRLAPPAVSVEARPTSPTASS